ncbi:MAG: LysM peptidoglycan-binding domain-containing protein [Deltaproteobacteria bacterium]|nr:LysM peptidoglycan-binding domain-containing protein [Deltaproteobacteria bacterium]
MRSCTLRFAAISLVLLSPGALAAEGEVAPAPAATEAAAAPAPVDPLVPAPEPMSPAGDPAPEANSAMDSAAVEETDAAATDAPPAEVPMVDTVQADAGEAGGAEDVAAEVAPAEVAPTLEAPTAAPSEQLAADDVAWDEFEAPAAESETAPADEPPAAPAPEPVAETKHLVLGPMAVDPEGREGRIHTVVRGDTLWDISEAYLGTPWVWPSVWTDNDDIEDPHVIKPDDHIWITSGEMRIVSKNEADSMIAAQRDLAQTEGADGEAWQSIATDTELEPAELIEGPEDTEGLAGDESPAALDPLSVAMPLETASDGDLGITVHVAELEAMGFVTTNDIEAATSIVDSPSPRIWLVNGDVVDLGIGEGDVEEGDEFTVFRNYVPVYDIEDGRLLGYHVHILGWAVVREVTGETALAEIRMSQSEMRRGDRVIRRPNKGITVDVKTTPDAIEGQIVFTPDSRNHMADGDHVYINRGSVHGFEVGSEVEVYVPGALRKERVSGDRVMTSDRIVSRMVLVEVKPESSVAFVVSANSELERGDRVRPSTREFVQR